MAILGDTWHANVHLDTVKAGSATPHSVVLSLWAPSGAGQSSQFYCWGWSFVPGPNNPSYVAGIDAQDEVERVRQELYHGCPPSNYNGPGIPATANPISTNGYYTNNPSGGTPNLLLPTTLTGYSTDGGPGTSDTVAIAKGRFTQSTSPVCPNGMNGELTTSGCSGSGTGLSPTTFSGSTSSGTISPIFTFPSGSGHGYEVCFNAEVTAVGTYSYANSSFTYTDASGNTGRLGITNSINPQTLYTTTAFCYPIFPASTSTFSLNWGWYGGTGNTNPTITYKGWYVQME